MGDDRCRLQQSLGGRATGAAAGKPAGSGVIVHSDGYILTAEHVIANAKRIFVVTAGEFRAPAILVSTDSEHDLALLKIETVGLTEAPIGYAGAVRLDQEIITVGFSFGLREVSVTRGRIAAVRTRGVQRVFQVDAAINPGNSGGPIFNGRGEVVGVMTTKFSHPSGIAPEGMSFAVPISYATPLLANIPDFDFTKIGKGRKAAKRGVESKGLAQEVVRTTVLIETVRNTDHGFDVTGSGSGCWSIAKERASGDRLTAPSAESAEGPRVECTGREGDRAGERPTSRCTGR